MEKSSRCRKCHLPVYSLIHMHVLVPGTSYVLRVSFLSAAASIGLVALVILVGYSFTWYGRQYITHPVNVFMCETTSIYHMMGAGALDISVLVMLLGLFI